MNYCGFLKTNATSGLLNCSSAEFSVDSLNPKFSDSQVHEHIILLSLEF